MSIQTIPAKDFELAVLNSSLHTPIGVFFTAPECAPCDEVQQILEKLAPEYEGRLHIAIIDITDEDIDPVLDQINLSSIPDFKLFDKKQIIAQIKGTPSEAQLRQLLDDHLLTEAQYRLQLLQNQVELLLSSEQFEEAMALTKTFQQRHPEDEQAMLIELAILVQMNQIEAALALIDQLPDSLKQSDRAQGVKEIIASLNATKQ